MFFLNMTPCFWFGLFWKNFSRSSYLTNGRGWGLKEVVFVVYTFVLNLAEEADFCDECREGSFRVCRPAASLSLCSLRDFPPLPLTPHPPGTRLWQDQRPQVGHSCVAQLGAALQEAASDRHRRGGRGQGRRQLLDGLGRGLQVCVPSLKYSSKPENTLKRRWPPHEDFN